MAIQLRLRRGTKVDNDAFTGAEGEVTYNTTTKGLRVHDGTTMGGFEVPVLVAVQRPSAENNFTWFRKWSDGWVEQGGEVAYVQASLGNTVQLPVTMANTRYYCNVFVQNQAGNGYIERMYERYTDHLQIGIDRFTQVDAVCTKMWYVCGMAA